ncbi:autophagy-related protein 27 [Podospora aff. communis PSN243]|uniref:Autophagy-related protein 27 n=1 Tax=Podospora aff. communis PSN243 TaxID=3040156 RepID=A0AAV9GZ16_9PEZI|nr:autophagy-related protein 27 [Podospora aff. communis PSN243]
MRPPMLTLLAATVAAAAAAAPSESQPKLDCKALQIDSHMYDFSALKGPHTVVTTEFAPPSYYNRTYTIDLCAPLVRKGDVDARFKCPDGTNVCAIKHHWDADKRKSEVVEEVIPIAGKFGEREMKWEGARLKAEKEGEAAAGVKITLGGGKWEGREQRAVVEMRCKKGVVGTEGEWEGEDEYVKAKRADKEEGDKKDGDGSGFAEKQLKKEDATLIWEGYKREGEVDTLFLTWNTEHACEKAVEDKPPADESRHWGFFTWLVVLVFMAVAAYLIFGSWLNYNRYGARGWDLLPHGDTLRDIPYLLKDWTRRVLNTVQSSGSRGGYSAV